MGALLQDFSVSRNNDETLGVTLESDIVSDSLAGATIEWEVFESVYGVPLPSPILISKTTADDGILIPGSPDLFFTIELAKADTAGLGVGYYCANAVIFKRRMARVDLARRRCRRLSSEY
jgi:hypothetical protein